MSTQDTDAIRSAAEAALRDVNAMDVTEPLDRAVLLGGVLLARLGRIRVPDTPKYTGQQREDANTSSQSGAQGSDGDLVGKIATGLKLDRNLVDQVYHAVDDTLSVIVSPRRLANSKATATRELAQLVAGGRQAAGLEEWTSAGVIRDVVSDFGKYDTANFAYTVSSMDDVFLLRGKGQSRTVKVSRPGMERVSDLVKSLAEATS
jgi:hypothetical protein